MPQAAVIAFTVVSAVASAAQQISAGQAQAASYENQARAADANARIAAMNANIAESEGRLTAAQNAQDWYKQLGRQRAAMAQGGVLESPTGLLVQEEAERARANEEFVIGHQTEMKKQGYLFEAGDLRSQASVARSNAGQASFGGWLGGISSFAGGMSDAYGDYIKYGA